METVIEMVMTLEKLDELLATLLRKKERTMLDEKISVQDFKDFYWLKDELIKFCRKNGSQLFWELFFLHTFLIIFI